MAWVYRIVRIETGFCYIGHTSKDPQRRWRAHFDLLNRGKHHARYLQNAWKKYGAAAFEFQIIEECSEADKLKREQHWINQHNSCFNLAKVAGSRKGVKYTKAQREKLSRLRMGHPVSNETRAKLSASAMGNQRTKGFRWSAEQRAGWSKSVKGKPRSAAQRASTLRSLELARIANRVNKPGMNWRLLHARTGA